jgi:hypothetical protein
MHIDTTMTPSIYYGSPYKRLPSYFTKYFSEYFEIRHMYYVFSAQS